MTRQSEFLTFDRETFSENFRGMEEVAYQAINSFIETLPSMLTSIEKAIKSQSSTELQISAHTLKGALSNFYAEPSRTLAWKLEQLGHGPIDSLARRIFLDLQSELTKLTNDLQKYAAERTSA